MRNRHSRRRDRGAAAVEFAIVLPLLLLVLAGIVDFGRYFYAQIQMTNAAREGARVMSVGSPDAQARAEAAMSPDLGANVSIVVGGCTGGNTTATATYTGFEWIILDPVLNVFGSSVGKTPTSTAVMRCVD